MARWLVIAAAVALPLVVSPATAEAYLLPKLAAGRLVVIALLVTLGIAAVMGRLRLRRTPLDIPLAIFVISALISTIFAVNRNLSIFGSYGRYEGLLTIVLYALLYWLAVQSLDGPKDATLVLRGLLGAGFVVSLLAILQVALGSLNAPGAAETGFSFGGVLRGYGTFGNPNVLGAFLAMLLPLAVWELLAARSASARWLSANLALVLALGLVVTFSRSAWLGAGIGIVAVLFVAVPPRIRWATLVIPIVALLIIVAATRSANPQTAPNVVQAAAGRLSTVQGVVAPASTGAFRLRVWEDSLALIASRPIIGYGPDSFGLVYPRFQTGNWAPGAIIDRPHSEPLGVAATQGLVGLAAYAALLLAIVATFWKRRRDLQSLALFGGVVAYVVYTTFNFSYLPATLPFWIFIAAAITIWRPGTWIDVQPSKLIVPRIVAAGFVSITALSAVPLVLAPYQADIAYRLGLNAIASGQRQEARAEVDQARTLAPWQSPYAVAAGSLALNLNSRGQAATDADWASARIDFLAASRLGSLTAASYRYLAMADAALGRHDEAITAARMAVQLNRFDPANQAELKLLLSGA
jgi:O-antigen ligase